MGNSRSSRSLGSFIFYEESLTMKYPRWVKTLLATPEDKRVSWVTEILDGLKEYRTKNPSKGQKFLSDMIEEGIKSGELEIVGFSPGTEYIKETGPADELGCIWTHAHMNPGLLLKHRDLPYLITIGPALRKDTSILNEVGMRNEGVRGLTGP